MDAVEIIEGDLVDQIDQRIIELGNDYDFSELKLNDKELLRRMAALTIRLESGEKELEKGIRAKEFDSNEALKEEQRLGLMRRDLVLIQESLGMSRAKRVEKLENNPLAIFIDIKARAKRFLYERFCHIFCPSCHQLIAEIHFSWPEEKSSLTITCGRCKTKTTLTGKEMLKNESENPYK